MVFEKEKGWESSFPSQIKFTKAHKCFNSNSTKFYVQVQVQINSRWLTYENMWLPVEVQNDLEFLWKDRLEPKIQFWVPLQYIYELIGDQIPNFPLTLHWNQKYLESQDTNSVSLHLKFLPLTFPRRQEQYPRKSIDSLDNRCPWLDWQVILKVTGLYLLHLYQKCTWPLNVGILTFQGGFF